MNERDFLTLAATLAGGSGEAEWRTSVSRSYYAAFHTARKFFSSLGFRVPRADRAHAYLDMRLQNSGDASVAQAGRDLHGLRQRRNEVDYDLHRPVDRGLATSSHKSAERIIASLDAALKGPNRAAIVTAIRDYEKNVLKDVTWKGP